MPQEEIDISILRYRREKRLSQADFARMVGVEQATVSNWESKKVRPCGENLEKIMDLLNREKQPPALENKLDELQLLKELLLAKDEIISYLRERLTKTKEGNP